MNLQDSFLNQIRKDGQEIKVVLLDGTVLIGLVKGFDNFTLILNSEGSQHLIYKHAISQMVYEKQEQGISKAKSIIAHNKVQSFNPIDLSKLNVEQAE